MEIELIAVLLAAFLVETLGWRPFTVEVKNTSYENIQPEIIGINVTTHDKAFDVNLNVKRDLSQLFTDIEVLHDSGDGKFDLVYANRTIDVCSFLRNRKSNVLMDLLLKILSDFGDVPKGCPIRKKHYAFLNATIDTEKVPPFMPDHTTRVSVVLWNKMNGKRSVFGKASGYIILARSFKRAKLKR